MQQRDECYRENVELERADTDVYSRRFHFQEVQTQAKLTYSKDRNSGGYLQGGIDRARWVCKEKLMVLHA